MNKIFNVNINSCKPLMSPKQLKAQVPVTDKAINTVVKGRTEIQNVLDKKDKKLLYKIFKENKKMLSAMNIKKKEFTIDIIYIAEEALAYIYN